VYGQLERDVDFLTNVLKHHIGKNLESNMNLLASKNVKAVRDEMFYVIEEQIINGLDNKLLDKSSSITEFNIMNPNEFTNGDIFKSLVKQEYHSTMSLNFENKK